MLGKMIQTHMRHPGTTAYTVCVPDWRDQPWHPLNSETASQFTVVRRYPAGTSLFTSPPTTGTTRVDQGPTRWGVLIMHLPAKVITTVNVSPDVLLHLRLGHCGSHVVPTILRGGGDTGMHLGPNAARAASMVSHQCVGCKIAKAVRPAAKSTSRSTSTKPCALLFIDVTGPFSTALDNSVYIFGAMDDNTGMLFTENTPSKSGIHMAAAMEAVLSAISRITASISLKDDGGGAEMHMKHLVVVIQTDNAGELTGHVFQETLKKHGITHRLSSAYLHQNNAFIERVWRDIQNGTRALLLGASLPKEYWCYAATHYTMLRNLIPRTGGEHNGKSPYERLFKRKPIYSKLIAFGAKGYVYLDYQQRSEHPVSGAVSMTAEYDETEPLSITNKINRRKLADRSRQLTYIGECNDSSSHKLIDPTHPQQVIRAGMVVFDESGLIKNAMPNATHGGESLLNSDFDVARPTGQMLETAIDKPFSVITHRVFLDVDPSEHDEAFIIFLVRSEQFPRGIWSLPEILMREEPDNTATVMLYLEGALTKGCINPYYPLGSTVETQLHSRKKGKRNANDKSWTKAVVIAYTPSPEVKDNIGLITLDGGASLLDVERGDVRIWQKPDIVLAATETINNTSVVTCPTTVEQAKRAPDSVEWMQAINKEISSQTEKGTYEFINEKDLPQGHKWIDMMMKLSLKWKKSGVLERRKARNVANGSLQSYGIDYEFTFAPSSQLVSVKIILVLAVCMDLKVYHLDVVTAFLNSTLEDDVYVRLPAGLGTPSRYAKLKKSVYGLKQAGHDWYKLQDKVIMSIPGICKSDVEPCWYYIKQGGLIVHILVHVDDYIIATNSAAWKHWFVKFFSEHFEVSDLGILDQVVGIGVQWGEKQVALTRTREILVTGERYGLGDAKSVLYPISCGFDLKKVKAGTGEKGLPYLNLMGELRYHERACRPDLSLALNKLGPFCADPSKEHYEALLKVARYAKGTADLPFIITSRKFANNRYRISLFTDATWSDCKETSRSTSGWAVYVNGNLVMSASKRQSCVTLSSTEAEICALSDGCKDLVHVYKTLKDLVEIELPMRVMVDNQATIAIMQNPVNNNRTRHIQTRLMWVRELVTGVLPDMEAMITLGYVRTDENVADYLTKPLQGEKFEHFRNQLMGHE